MAKRLYVAGHGQDLVFCVAADMEEGKLTLGPTCRLPDPDDIRVVWELGKFGQLSSAELLTRYGVRRQTVDYWYHKAGGDLLRRRTFLDTVRLDRVKELVLDKRKKRSATQIARCTNTSTTTVREIAKRYRVKLPSTLKRPSDDKLVELANGRTWPELAEAAGMRLASLRSYVYSNPELAARIREVRKAQPCGPQSHGKVNRKKLVHLANKGLSAYAISVQLGVEHMVVRYWMRKLAHRITHATTEADHGRAPEPALGSGDGGAASNP